MKTLFWEKIKDNDYYKTIWPTVAQNQENFTLDLPDFVELFEEKKVVEVKVSLIDDDKRVQQLNLAAKKLTDMLKLTYPQLRQMVMSLDDSELGFDQFTNLKSLAPSKEEITKVSTFKGDPETLDLPSRWIFEMKDIPNFIQRVDLFGFSKDYDTDFKVARDRIDNIEKMIEYFVQDPRFLSFLKCCLDVGNLINMGTRRGAGYGFKFASFKSYASCKSNNGKVYLLPYLIQKVNEQKPDVIDFYPEMNACINGACTFDIDDVINGLGTIKGKFNQIKTLIESSEKANPKDEEFIGYFNPFFSENIKQTVELEDRSKIMKEKLLEMAVKLGDEMNKIKGAKSSDIIGEYRKIFAEFGKIIDPIMKAREKERKTGTKKEAKQKKKKIEED